MENIYVNFYKVLQNSNKSLNSKTFIVDFKKAAINAIQCNFSNTLVRGCFFHPSQSIWRHMQNLWFQQRYTEDSIFALLSFALSLVLENNVNILGTNY